MVEKKNNPPVDQMNIRGVKVAVWEHERNGKVFRQVSLKKNYKDDEGNFHEVDSFVMQDIPNLIVALEEIYKKEVLGEYKK